VGALLMGYVARAALTEYSDVTLPSLNFDAGNWIGSGDEFRRLDYDGSLDLADNPFLVASVATDQCFALRSESGVAYQFCGALSAVPGTMLNASDRPRNLLAACGTRATLYSEPGFKGRSRQVTVTSPRC
jgi:hypothetical protein